MSPIHNSHQVEIAYSPLIFVLYTATLGTMARPVKKSQVPHIQYAILHMLIYFPQPYVYSSTI